MTLEMTQQQKESKDIFRAKKTEMIRELKYKENWSNSRLMKIFDLSYVRLKKILGETHSPIYKLSNEELLQRSPTLRSVIKDCLEAGLPLTHIAGKFNLRTTEIREFHDRYLSNTD